MTEDVIKLGGNIELIGFKQVDIGSLIIVKKIVGSHVKKFSESVSNFEKFSLTLVSFENKELSASLQYDGNNVEVSSSASNLFTALDNVMKHIEEKIK